MTNGVLTRSHRMDRIIRTDRVTRMDRVNRSSRVNRLNRVTRNSSTRVRWKLGLALGVVIAGILAGLTVMAGSGSWGAVLLPIKKVMVTGEFNKLVLEELRSALQGHVAGGFFSINVRDVKHIAEQVPWVRSASVRRVWPDAIHIVVHEHQALACWNDSGVISRAGTLIDSTQDVPDHPAAPDHLVAPDHPVASDHPVRQERCEKGLPAFYGPAGTQALLFAQYQKLNRQLVPVRQQVIVLTLDERRTWRAVLTNSLNVPDYPVTLVEPDDTVRIELIMGRGRNGQQDRDGQQDHDDRGVMRYVQAFPKVLAYRVGDIERVDLRYSNGFAVHWKVQTGGPRDG